jgi:hypothetical protein
MKLSIAIAALLVSVPASAQGVVLSPSQLGAPVRADLQAKVAAAQKKDPASFKALADVREALPRLDKEKRGRQAPLSPSLRALGASALYPLINEAAFAATPRGELKTSAWSAWRLAVIEVLGEQRSEDAAPIFIALLEGSESDFELNRLAAGALGELGTDAAAKTLVKLAQGSKRDAVLAGMGTCRRLVVVQALASAASTAQGQSLVRIAQSLGQVGNSWAWKTPAVTAKSEESMVRGIAARALVQIYLKDGAARQAASNALMVVDSEQTAALLHEAKQTASNGNLILLLQLEDRFARNPVR